MREPEHVRNGHLDICAAPAALRIRVEKRNHHVAGVEELHRLVAKADPVLLQGLQSSCRISTWPLIGRPPSVAR